jgi:hypothetical protein
MEIFHITWICAIIRGHFSQRKFLNIKLLTLSMKHGQEILMNAKKIEFEIFSDYSKDERDTFSRVGLKV